jgi:hypothetical protein
VNEYFMGEKYRIKRQQLKNRGSTIKKPLTLEKNPFVFEFNYDLQ